MPLSLHLNKTSFRPGDEVRGEVSWSLPQPPDRGKLRLRWKTAGAGDTDERVVGYVSLIELPRPAAPVADGDPYRGGAAPEQVVPLDADDRRTFRFGLPSRPVSFSGKLITLSWVVEVVDVPGMACEVPIVVSPTKAELRP